MNDKTLVGLLISTIALLGGVIGYLFKLYLSRNKEIVATEASMQKERSDWALERSNLASSYTLERQKLSAEFEVKEVEIRADYEKRFRELVERYDGAARRDSERHRDHEDEVRKDFAELMEKVAGEASKSSEILVQMLQRFYDRFVGPRPRY